MGYLEATKYQETESTINLLSKSLTYKLTLNRERGCDLLAGCHGGEEGAAVTDQPSQQPTKQEEKEQTPLARSS